MHIEAGIQMGFRTLRDSQWDCKKDNSKKIKSFNFYDFLVNDSKLCKLPFPITILSVKSDKLFFNIYFLGEPLF